MGRKKLPPTKLQRIDLVDLEVLKKLAREQNMSLRKYISIIVRGGRR